MQALIADSLLAVPPEKWREAARFHHPHPAQQEVLEVDARFTVLGCGRRFGKTDLGVHKIANAIIDTALPFFYIVPTNYDIRKVWDDVEHILHDLIEKKNISQRRMEFVTGASLSFFSFEAIDRVRSNAFAGGICDEAAAVSNLGYAWERVIMPTLADYAGWCWFLSSFRGKNYFYQLYSQAVDPLKKAWAGFSFTTADNPYIAPSEIALAKATLPAKAFEEEYLAVPNEDYGAVFRGVRECIQPVPKNPIDSIVFGVDWAREHDFTVITVMGKTSRQIYEMDRFNQVDWTIQRGRIVALAEKWKPELILAEWNSIGDPNIEELNKIEGLNVQPFKTTAASKPLLIRGLALAIEKRDIGLIGDDEPNGAMLINELQSYEMERLPSGNFRYGAPSDGHDDTVIATALAWQAATMPTRDIEVTNAPEFLASWRG